MPHIFAYNISTGRRKGIIKSLTNLSPGYLPQPTARVIINSNVRCTDRLN
ncbi:MAG: hypothetical protein LPD71_04990 [Shewanella sp.]|nr:hypothetical protein [Shewanella sp.]MCF1430056.1 hypothetical protein [Shewanella sp.]MCF1438119.1 hypothetical protein [Shewanella sp.]MCF1458553.1 hypothetical protein [Shewanella sp.]